MISATLAYRVSLAAGLLALATLILLQLLPIPECGSVASRDAVIAEELARRQSDLDGLFGARPTACTPARAHALNIQTTVDTVALIPAYGVFLVFFFLAMARRDESAAFLGFVLSVVAVLADYGENICLFHVSNLPHAPGWALVLLPWATGIKWLLLGLGGAVGGMILIRSGRENYPAAAACALGLLGPVLALANPLEFRSFAAAVGLSWLAFLVVVARNAFAASAVPQLEVEDGAA